LETPLSIDTLNSIADLQQLARRRVPRMFYDYADSGSWSESTYRANEADFARLLLRQRVARDIGGRSLATTMLGRPVAMPVALAPTGLAGMQHADGEILSARAACAFGVPFTLSTMSICSIEDVAEHVGHPFWFQLYVMRAIATSCAGSSRAKAAQCEALVLTRDLQVPGVRHKDVRNGLSAPPKLRAGNIVDIARRPRWWSAMLRTRRRTFGNIVGHVAVASDARSTMIGRPFLYGLGAMGEAGVTRCLQILHDELDRTLALCGHRDILDVGRETLVDPRRHGAR
jgi:L-lactate dehydrogenase (cytochrome)